MEVLRAGHYGDVREVAIKAPLKTETATAYVHRSGNELGTGPPMSRTSLYHVLPDKA